jgi:CRISPR/Cas system CSM-associated protein Csm2 small subunit
MRFSEFTPPNLGQDTLHTAELNLILLRTILYKDVIEEQEGNEKEICEEFHIMRAVIKREWMRSNYEQKHAIRRLAVHDFYHSICRRRSQQQVRPVCSKAWKRCHLQQAEVRLRLSYPCNRPWRPIKL